MKQSEESPGIVIVYTGDGKGKTSASLGLMIRALGAGKRVAYIQFIKAWEVSEHTFIARIAPEFGDQLLFYKGGKGFYHAGPLSAKATEDEHRAAAADTYARALTAATSGDYDIVICDEINNAVHDGLLTVDELTALIDNRAAHTSLCLTGRNFPVDLLPRVAIATDMTKLRHHYDDGVLASVGIDY